MIATLPAYTLADAYADQCHTWTLAELIADPSLLYRVPDRQLEYLYRDSIHAVTLPPDDEQPQVREQVRERLQQLRIDIAKTIARRRQMDADDRAKTATRHQDEPQPDTAPETPPTDAELALRLLRGLVQLANGGRPDDDQDGGRPARLPVRPIQPTPPAGRNLPHAPKDLGF